MATSIKAINVLKTRFSVNGKLAVCVFGPNREITGFKYSEELTSAEDKHFKKYLSDLGII